MTDVILKGQLNRMCKYFRHKHIEIIFEYNNSLGHHHIRNYNGEYDSFEIEGDVSSGYYILFKNDGYVVFEQSINPHGWFNGVGRLTWSNCGPYCYFQISICK